MQKIETKTITSPLGDVDTIVTNIGAGWAVTKQEDWPVMPGWVKLTFERAVIFGLYLLRPIKTPDDQYINPDHDEYDTAQGLVICASSVSLARTIATNHCGDEGPEAWLDPKSTTCKLLDDPEIGLVLRDFNSA